MIVIEKENNWNEVWLTLRLSSNMIDINESNFYVNYY